MNFNEYIIFADESGDHGMSSINPENPVFVLAFCILKKHDYCSVVKETITRLKLRFWGHDLAKTNSIGLQIADLVAHPIARHMIKGDLSRPFEVVREKILGYPEYEEIGLKRFPLKNEVPQPKQDADRELPIP